MQRTLCVLALAALLSTGCFYFDAQEQLNQAELAFEQIKLDGAEQTSPYAYYAASAYLERARIENKESDFSSAREFAIKSQSFSRTAAAAKPASSDDDWMTGDDVWGSDADAGDDAAETVDDASGAAMGDTMNAGATGTAEMPSTDRAPTSTAPPARAVVPGEGWKEPELIVVPTDDDPEDM